MKLKDRVALITGASPRGLAIAARFLEEGAAVILADADADRLAAVQAFETCLIDFSSCAKTKQRIDGVAARHGRLDILVNNADACLEAPVTEMTSEQFDLLVEVNLKSVFCCTKAACFLMREHGFGRIINLTSPAAKNGSPNGSGYAAVKAGVTAMTQTWAKELGRDGITVNAVAPGVLEGDAADDDTAARICAFTPVRRLGTNAEIAAACAYLASEEAGYVNGAVLQADGGLVL